MTIQEIAALAAAGIPLADIIPAGSDVEYWQRLVNRAQANQPKRKRNSGPRPSGRPSRKTNYAAQVAARCNAMAEQLDQVNGREVEK